MFPDDHEMIGRGSAGRLIAVAAAALFVIGLPAAIPSADAQMIPSGPEPAAAAKGPAGKGAPKGQPADAEAKRDPAVALRSLETGIKSYEIGKLEPAVQQLTSALSAGLPSQQMARALYYRGLAFRKQAKPAQAISDLTSAIWLKGGLADAERANAIESRAAAYREAGIGDPAPVASDASRSAAAPASGWQTATASGSSTSTPKLSAAPDEPAAPQASGSSGGVGSFFSGLFGGSSSSAAAPAPSTTASTSAPASPVTATSSWGDATSVAASKARPSAAAATAPPATAQPPNVKVAAAAPAALAAPAAPAFKGKFRLQVAAVRSRAEAEALAQKLKQAHGAAIGGREPAIEQSVIGAMGTFYRVRVGPYADANEPRQLCARIKPDGFDCLVVTQ